MELQVILELYEVVIIPGILFNCEAWTLTGSDIESLESMQIWAIKRLLDLPRTTPTTSILYSLKIPYVETRITSKATLVGRKNVKKLKGGNKFSFSFPSFFKKKRKKRKREKERKKERERMKQKEKKRERKKEKKRKKERKKERKEKKRKERKKETNKEKKKGRNKERKKSVRQREIERSQSERNECIEREKER